MTQQFTVTPGASYTASVYAMTPAGNPLTGNINAELQLLFFTSTGTQISSYSAPNQVLLLSGSSGAGGPLTGSVGNQGWNHFSTTAVAPSNAASAKVQVVTFSDGGTFGGAVYYDAIKFGPSATGPSTLVATTSLTNQGTITIGPTNSITVNGGFSQTSTGTLDIQLGGPPTTNIAGSLTITGGATLAGTLKAELLYGYTPATTDTFTPVTFASETGSFANYSGPSGTGYQLAATTSFTNIMLSGAPTAAVTSTISAASPLHAVSANMLGVNMVWWDTADVSTQTQQMSAAAGFKLFRFPGGSSSDEYHFNVSANGGDSSAITVPQFAQYITSAGGTGLVTLDYGSGSPQEAAAELAYLEGSATDTTVIGNGIEWNTTTNQWQTVNWGTAGYWAALRGAKPLATDDGLNFLRINDAAPFTAIRYWEVGNEEYGSWETDHHGTAGPGGVSTGAARRGHLRRLCQAVFDAGCVDPRRRRLVWHQHRHRQRRSDRRRQLLDEECPHRRRKHRLCARLHFRPQLHARSGERKRFIPIEQQRGLWPEHARLVDALWRLPDPLAADARQSGQRRTALGHRV